MSSPSGRKPPSIGRGLLRASDFPAMDDLAIIPAPPGSEGYVPLSRTRQGRLFRKQILTLGSLVHPKTGETLTLDEGWYSRLKDNFTNGVCDIVQVPLADAQNRHSEDPLRNIGEVVDLDRDGEKVYAMIDARDPDAADKLGKTLLGASAFLHMDYTDSRTGKKAGPALLHVAVTNRPYITNLEDYEEVITASADGTGDVFMLAEEEPPVPLTRDELLEQLKSEHGIDVAALQEQAAQRTDTAQLTSAIVEALKGQPNVQLTGDGNGDLAPSDVVGAIVELARTNESQAEAIGQLQRQGAEHEVDGYISAGRVLPKQRDAFVELALTNRDMLDTLLPAEPIVRLAVQEGIAGPDGAQKQELDVDADVTRLTAAFSEYFSPNGTKAK